MSNPNISKHADNHKQINETKFKRSTTFPTSWSFFLANSNLKEVKASNRKLSDTSNLKQSPDLLQKKA